MRSPLLAAVAILSLAVCPHAQQSTPAKATVSGSVLDAANGQPLRKATVTLTVLGSDDADSPSHSSTSGPDGTFSISDIEPGRYRLLVERSGFLMNRKARKLSVVNLAAGQAIRSLQIPMVAGGVVTGRVLDKDGDPLPKATVQLIRKGRGGAFADAAETNDMGEYRVFQVPPGTYYVAATVARDQVSGLESGAKAAPDIGYVPMYYPSTKDFAQAVALEIKSGNEVRADFTMLLAQVFAVRGRVLTAPGERADHTAVMVYPAGNPGISSSRSASLKRDGTFEATNIPPGRYVAMAIAVDIASRKQRSTQAEFEVAEANVEGLVLNLTNVGAKVRGRIFVESKPTFDLSQLSIYLQRTDEDRSVSRYASFGTGAASGYARVNRDGTFAVDDVISGSYFPAIFSYDTGASDYYVKAIHQGPKDISDGELVIGEATSVQPVEILLGAGGQSVEGVVQDSAGKPAGDAFVVALPNGKRRKRLGSYVRSVTDQQGRFALAGLQPGEYTLIALDEAEEEIGLDPEFLAQFESKGLAFRAREHGRDTVTLNLVAVDEP